MISPATRNHLPARISGNPHYVQGLPDMTSRRHGRLPRAPVVVEDVAVGVGDDAEVAAGDRHPADHAPLPRLLGGGERWWGGEREITGDRSKLSQEAAKGPPRNFHTGSILLAGAKNWWEMELNEMIKN